MMSLVEHLDAIWMQDAACQGISRPDLFFPPHLRGLDRHVGRRIRRDLVDQAKLICCECPVRAECLDYALKADIRYGIWGGVTETERTRISGRRRW